ncbi:MAG: hypothetical protein ACLR1T_05700 [Evtepia gabavorous]
MCPMPNLKPVPDSLAHLRPQLEAIARDSVIHTYPYGAITVGEQGKRWPHWRRWLLMWWLFLMMEKGCRIRKK